MADIFQNFLLDAYIKVLKATVYEGKTNEKIKDRLPGSLSFCAGRTWINRLKRQCRAPRRSNIV